MKVLTGFLTNFATETVKVLLMKHYFWRIKMTSLPKIFWDSRTQRVFVSSRMILKGFAGFAVLQNRAMRLPKTTSA